jgi:hypothetical protein
MKIKQVKQYICDFCGKKGLSSGHMKRHETHCTKNPDRKCRMCGILGNTQQPISHLMAVLPDPAEYAYEDELGWEGYRTELFDAVNAVIPKLRDATSDCPMCIMAALRQRGIPVKGVTSFDYKKEVAGAWDMVRDEERTNGEFC